MKDTVIVHRGVAHDENPPGRGSGRHPYGSGENPYQHQSTFLSEVYRLRKKGFKDTEIAKTLLGEEAKTTQLRAEISIETKNERKKNMERATKLYEKYGNYSEVGRQMGVGESTVRSWLDPVKAERTDRYQSTADFLKKKIAERGVIDISAGVEIDLGVPAYTKDVAVDILKKEGYVQTWVTIEQLGTKNKTTMKVLAPPGTPTSEIQANKFNVKAIRDYTPDQGKTWWTPEFPESLDSKRIKIRYGDEGGKEKDGVIEIRRGVEDLSLGEAQYAQVRIAVDGTHYMKGMAIYSDGKDMPKGVDIIYNTNKSSSTPMIGEKDHEVLKRLKINQATGEVDRDNPFGALIKSPKDRDGVVTAGGQRHYIDKDGKEKLSPINKLQDEGDWDSWSRTLSSQFLSKQPLKLIKQQLNLTIADKRAELEKINNLTNPAIKQKLLEDFANGCDADSVSLSAKGFKNQAFQVILPITNMKETEIYAPRFKDGDTVALVRYPHGGLFEIPILKVNNRRNTEAQKVMKDAKDAVGINAKVAQVLSGADFDGDTVICIPLASNNLAVKSRKPLKDLEDFDPKIYKLPDSAPPVKNRTKQNQMGQVTNLITDMTVGGAGFDEICRAVKHSMVVIDSEKHHLDYQQSARDNRINDLKKTYQGVTEKGNVKGASTILSRAKAKTRIDKQKEITNVKIMTPEEHERWNNGERIFRSKEEKMLERITDPSKMTPDELKIYNAGKKVYRTSTKNRQQEVHQMETVRDARDLVRDPNNQKEMAYANYANELKALANEARKGARSIKPTPVNQSAKKVYAAEVEQLNRDLRIAKMNQPRERQAQLLANAMVSEKFNSNPDMDYEHKQREKARCLTEARAIVGAKKEKIVITDREWEAIQANAISFSKLKDILNNTDQDAFKKRATPKSDSNASLTKAQINKIKAMMATGMYTQAEIAESVGVSTSTVSKAVNS